jgi:hypothetical protein
MGKISLKAKILALTIIGQLLLASCAVAILTWSQSNMNSMMGQSHSNLMVTKDLREIQRAFGL